jgi:hypothetical protein
MQMALSFSSNVSLDRPHECASAQQEQSRQNGRGAEFADVSRNLADRLSQRAEFTSTSRGVASTPAESLAQLRVVLPPQSRRLRRFTIGRFRRVQVGVHFDRVRLLVTG